MNNPIISLNSADLENAVLKGVDLKNVDLQGAIMRHADLRDTNLQGADLRSTDLQGAIMQSADLRGADLRGANLNNAILQNANIERANLQGADLRHANLRSAFLRGANLWGAIIKGADMHGADLTEAIMPDGKKYRPKIHKVKHHKRKIIKKNSKFYIITGIEGQFYFRLIAPNGELILASEGYSSKSDCKNGIVSVKKNAIKDGQYKQLVASNGDLYFNLVDRNNVVIGISETSKTKQGRENNIEMVKATAPISSVEDVA